MLCSIRQCSVLQKSTDLMSCVKKLQVSAMCVDKAAKFLVQKTLTHYEFRKAMKVPCRRALNVLCRRALIGPVEGCWTCLMFHFCSHDFVHSNVIVPVQLHVQMQLGIYLQKNCNQLYSAHRMILATLLQCCQHDSGSSFIIILYLWCRNWNCSPVWLVDS